MYSRSTIRGSRCRTVRRSTTSPTRTTSPTAALHPGRRLAHRSLQRCAAAQGHGAARGHAARARGGDTQFANMAAAYAALAGRMQRAHRRSDGDPCLSKQPQRAEADEHCRTARRNACRTPCCIRWCAPIRRPARRSIYINPIRIEGILGLDHREALPLLDELLAHATRGALPVPPRVGAGRSRDVGQSLPAAQGERRLRHDADPLSLPRHAGGRRAGGSQFARRPAEDIDESAGARRRDWMDFQSADLSLARRF